MGRVSLSSEKDTKALPGVPERGRQVQGEYPLGERRREERGGGENGLWWLWMSN